MTILILLVGCIVGVVLATVVLVIGIAIGTANERMDCAQRQNVDWCVQPPIDDRVFYIEMGRD